MDPQLVIKTLRLNKFHHKTFNPILNNKGWSMHFSEVIDKNKVANFDFKKEFDTKFTKIKRKNALGEK